MTFSFVTQVFYSECSLESQEASLESPGSPPIHINNSNHQNHQIPSKKSVKQPKGKKMAITHEEFKGTSHKLWFIISESVLYW